MPRQHAARTIGKAARSTQQVITHRPLAPQQLERKTYDDTPPADILRYLRIEDQRYLAENKQQLTNILEHAHKLKRAGLEISPIAQLDPAIPPYTNPALRNKARDFNLAADSCIAALEHLREHFTDLQYEGYEKSAEGRLSAWGEWEREVAEMSPAERLEKMRDLKYGEEAEVSRLKKTTRALLRWAHGEEENETGSMGAVKAMGGKLEKNAGDGRGGEDKWGETLSEEEGEQQPPQAGQPSRSEKRHPLFSRKADSQGTGRTQTSSNEAWPAAESSSGVSDEVHPAEGDPSGVSDDAYPATENPNGVSDDMRSEFQTSSDQPSRVKKRRSRPERRGDTANHLRRTKVGKNEDEDRQSAENSPLIRYSIRGKHYSAPDSIKPDESEAAEPDKRAELDEKGNQKQASEDRNSEGQKKGSDKKGRRTSFTRLVDLSLKLNQKVKEGG